MEGRGVKNKKNETKFPGKSIARSEGEGEIYSRSCGLRIIAAKSNS